MRQFTKNICLSFFIRKFYDPQWSEGYGSGRETYPRGRSERGREGRKYQIYEETSEKYTQLRTEVSEGSSEVTWDTPQPELPKSLDESLTLSRNSISKEDVDKIAALVRKHGFNLPESYGYPKELVFFDEQGNRHGILFWNRADPLNANMVVYYYKDGIKDSNHLIPYTIKNNTIQRGRAYFWTDIQEAKAEWDTIMQWVADLIAWRGTYDEKKSHKKKPHK